MENDESLLESIKNLQNQNVIIFNNIFGLIIDIEETDYKNFKLDIKINQTIYKGIYINLNKSEIVNLEKGYKIALNYLKLIKKKRNIYIYTASNYAYNPNIDNDENKIKKEEDLINEKNCTIINLNLNSLINTIKGKSDIIYDSDIFIYKKNNELYTLISITTNKEYILGKNLFDSKTKEFVNFLIKKEITQDNLILIDNYILTEERIEFNNLTLFNIVTLEYIDEYFRKKFKRYHENIYPNNEDIKIIKYEKMPLKQDNLLLIKVIDIQDDYLLGIDYSYNLFKLHQNPNKFREIKDVYTIVFLKNFYLSEEDSIYIVKLCDFSYVYIFENSFEDLLLNDLTLIKFHYLDFIEPSKMNYFNEIIIDKNEFSFEISKKSEYVILFIKFDINYNFFPHKVKLMSKDNNEIHCYSVLLYLGLLNNINCLINFTEIDKYGYEYFYYNFYCDLPRFHTTIINNKIYKIENSDNYNSKTRKRFILLNYYDKDNTDRYHAIKMGSFYYNKKSIKKKTNKIDKGNVQNQEKDNNKNEIIEKDDLDDLNFLIETEHISLQFYILYKEQKSNIFGIYEIEEIKDKYKPEKKIIFNSEEYKIFFEFYNKIKDDSNQKLDSFEKFKNNEIFENLVEQTNIDFSSFNYQSYIIYINMCLFHYLNKTKLKEDLVNEFKLNFNLLKESNLSYRDRIRIMRFICREQSKISEEDRRYTLLILDSLSKNNSYKIAINYNKSIIKNLEESSKLFIAFLQLDSYILYNYNIGSNGYTLSLEPLILTKSHILASYDNFIFTVKEKPKEDETVVFAYQCPRDDITIVNDYGLFPSANNRNSDKLRGNNYAVPITMILFHEKNAHSKKDKKNKRRLIPLHFYTRKNIKFTELDNQEKIKTNKIEKGEAGHLVEYFIRYKHKNLAAELKKNLKLGNIINDVKFFTSKNFEKLNQTIDDSNKEDIKNKNNISVSSIAGHSDIQKLKNLGNNYQLRKNSNKEKNKEDESNSHDITYYERNYLLEGKYFVYPDSIPINYRNYNEPKNNPPKGLIDYLEKYKDAIDEGRKKHYGY